MVFTKDLLRKHYWNDGLSCVDIGEIYKKDPKTIWYWMKKLNVPTRPRGSDKRQHFKKGSKITLGFKHSDATKEKIRQARINDGSKCLFLPNGDHVLKGRTGPNHPSWKGGGTPLRQAFYSSDDWKKVCVNIWDRDDAICQRCGLDHRYIDRDVKKFHIHHIYGFTEYSNLRSDDNNLVLLCDTCHRWVHSRKNESGDWIENGKKTRV